MEINIKTGRIVERKLSRKAIIEGKLSTVASTANVKANKQSRNRGKDSRLNDWMQKEQTVTHNGNQSVVKTNVIEYLQDVAKKNNKEDSKLRKKGRWEGQQQPNVFQRSSSAILRIKTVMTSVAVPKGD
ncbi:hypothetical protein RUM43_006631 [Polyplax serrata]|uniref:Uncharacterized protein n=1 Tax=Polyplax serrata TaxID=468196 RepID=A0AAN8S3X5_POLSC